MGRMKRAHAFCFTVNNPTVADKQRVRDLPGARYLIWQVEKGEQGTPHIQGYVWLKRQIVLTSFRKLIPRGHIEVAKGSPKQNQAYCSKEEGRIEGPFEVGQCPQKGRRTDILALKKTIDSGASLMQIREKHYSTYAKYKNFGKSGRLSLEKDGKMVFP